MNIALLQFDPLWEDKHANLNFVTGEIEKLPADIDVIVLPEMFSTGFTMKPWQVAETEQGNTLKLIQELAQIKQTAITGSWIVKENEQYFNRLFFVFPDGSYQTYNKRHLFTLAGEDKLYQSGNNQLIVSYKNWNICLLVCYDLRFPVFSRIINQNYDLLVYIASWPDKRIYAWDSLLKARAIENMSYVVAVNRCGTDPYGVYYSGHSQAIDYMGEYLLKPLYKQTTQIINIEKPPLLNARTKLAFLNDADVFEIKNFKKND